jgi:hypothetical protein
MNKVLNSYTDRKHHLHQANAWGRWINDDEAIQIQFRLPNDSTHSIQLKTVELLEVVRVINESQRKLLSGKEEGQYRTDVLNLESEIRESIQAVSYTPVFQLAAGFLDHEKHAMEWVDDWANSFLKGGTHSDMEPRSSTDLKTYYQENIASQ